jgi:hypothetical protein
MRRSRTAFASLALLLSCIVSILPGCGGSSASKVVGITVTPSPVSVAYGQVLQLSATAVNSNNGVVSTGFAFASSNTSAVSIAPSGALCGGTWDANFVTCSKPASSVPATATITVTAQTVTQTVQAYVHEKVDSVVITSVPGSCTSLAASASQLPKFVAAAKSNDPTVCVPPKSAAPCDITADLTGGNTTVNPFQWSSSDTTIATIDTSGTSTAGTVTPIGPGQANIFASTAGVNSPAVPFTTCPVNSITLTATNAANGGLGPFTISGSQALSAAVIDSTGATITFPALTSTTLALNYPNLSWMSTDLYTVAAAAQTQTVKTTVNGVTTSQTVPLAAATATGVKDGVALLVASCTPPSCNKNLFPVYSNPIVTTDAGSNVAAAYVASSQSTEMLVIDVASGTALITYQLPIAPTSFLFNRQGTKAVLGSANGVIAFDPTVAPTTSTSTTLPFTTLPFNGDVLGISPDGSLAAVFGQVAGQIQNSIGIINLSQSALAATFPVAGTVTAADFSIDSRYLWVAAGNRVYVFTMGTANTPFGSTFFTTNSPVNDLAFLAGGPFVYLAGDTLPTNITARANCLGGQQSAATVADVQTGTAPTNVRALPNGKGILALDPPGIDVVTLANPTAPFVGCPPTLSGIESMTPQPLALGATPVNQFMVMPDSSVAVLTSTSGSVVLVNLATLNSLTASTVTLANSATLKDATTGLLFKGDIPASSGIFVVGGSDGFLHEILVSTATDNVGASPVGLTQADGITTALPNLVAIRNR